MARRDICMTASNKLDKFKTNVDRATEIDRLKSEFHEHFGVLTDHIAERESIFRDMDRFVEDGISMSYKVRLPNTKRIAHVSLCNRRLSTSSIRLEFREDV